MSRSKSAAYLRTYTGHSGLRSSCRGGMAARWSPAPERSFLVDTSVERIQSSASRLLRLLRLLRRYGSKRSVRINCTEEDRLRSFDNLSDIGPRCAKTSSQQQRHWLTGSSRCSFRQKAFPSSSSSPLSTSRATLTSSCELVSFSGNTTGRSVPAPPQQLPAL